MCSDLTFYRTLSRGTVFSWTQCSSEKNYEIPSIFARVIEKIKVARFLWPTVYKYGVLYRRLSVLSTHASLLLGSYRSSYGRTECLSVPLLYSRGTGLLPLNARDYWPAIAYVTIWGKHLLPTSVALWVKLCCVRLSSARSQCDFRQR